MNEDEAFDARMDLLRDKAMWVWRTLVELDPDGAIELIHDALVDVALDFAAGPS